MDIRYPNATVYLDEGNAFGILGKVRSALRREGASNAELDQFHMEATSGDYDHLLQTVMRWVNVETP